MKRGAMGGAVGRRSDHQLCGIDLEKKKRKNQYQKAAD